MKQISDPETLKAIIEKFSMFDIPQFVISGGEPFLHPDFYNIIDFISQSPFAFILTTNGTIINNKALELISHAPNISIQVSLDGSCARIHNDILISLVDADISSLSKEERRHPKREWEFSHKT